MSLCKKEKIYQKVYIIVNSFIELDNKNMDLSKKHVKNNILTIHFAFSALCPKTYCRTNYIWIKNKSNFHYVYNQL